jgi:hypothetical protein
MANATLVKPFANTNNVADMLQFSLVTPNVSLGRAVSDARTKSRVSFYLDAHLRLRNWEHFCISHIRGHD